MSTRTFSSIPPCGAAILAVALGCLVSQPISAAAPQLTEFPLPSATAGLAGITAGPDGNLWFVERNANQIGKMAPNGTLLAEYPAPAGTFLANELAKGITAGPDGNVWFVISNSGGAGGSAIGRITPAGVIKTFPVPTAVPYAVDIVTGADGNLWFTEYDGDNIGRITPAGVINEYPLPHGTFPWSIALGADGNVWFGETAGMIGRISPAGTIQEFPLNQGRGDNVIAAGPDGNIWLFDAGGIGVVTPQGAFSELPAPSARYPASVLHAGPDGNMWMTTMDGIGSVSPSGQVNDYPVPTASSRPAGITTGPDGNLWFTESASGKIVRASLPSHPCVAGDTTLCIDDQPGDARWQATVSFSTTQGGGRSGKGHALPLASLGVSHGGLFWFFDGTNPEMLLKMLNACSLNERFWVFYSATTNVGFTVTVTDTHNGRSKVYSNKDGKAAPPIQDTSAFSCTGGDARPAPDDGSAGESADRDAVRDLAAWGERGSSLLPSPEPGSRCSTDATTICIDGRFKIQATFQTTQGGGKSGSGQAISLQSLGVAQGGLLWFFSADNPEMLVKVIDACTLNHKFWVFYAAGTNAGFTLTVTDTQTGHQVTYKNADLSAAPPVQDTSALPCS